MKVIYSYYKSFYFIKLQTAKRLNRVKSIDHKGQHTRPGHTGSNTLTHVSHALYQLLWPQLP